MQSGYGALLRRGVCAVLTVWMAAAPGLPALAEGPGISVYDAVSVDGALTLHTEFLNGVSSAESAWEAVSRQANAMT